MEKVTIFIVFIIDFKVTNWSKVQILIKMIPNWLVLIIVTYKSISNYVF